jgi:hypothetical protein
MSHSNDWRLGVNSITGRWWNRSRPRARGFVWPVPIGYNASITGVTRDSTGAAIGNCAVNLYRTWDDTMISETTSDGSGNFTILAPSSGPYYMVAYLPGSPDVAGTTVNTLVAA